MGEHGHALDSLVSLLEHPGQVSREQAEELQRELASRVRLEPLQGPVSTVCGVDCAYSPDGSLIHAAAVLLSTGDLSVLARGRAWGPCPFPYVPGLLALREARATVTAVRSLPGLPDLLLCDGHGTAHPRGFGLACAVGLLLGIPTVGVAKGRLCGGFEMPGPARGDRSPLLCEEPARAMIGTVLRTRAGTRPVFVSAGHGISHEEAAEWVLRLTERSRWPEPLRLAHRAANEDRGRIS